MSEPIEISMKIFWWDSEEGEIFWIYSDPEKSDEYPWCMGSADPHYVYCDFVQIRLTIDRFGGAVNRSSPVGLDDEEIERTIARFATEDAEAIYDGETLAITTSILKVKHLSHLRRIMHEFDPVSLDRTPGGRAFMAMLLAESRED